MPNWWRTDMRHVISYITDTLTLERNKDGSGDFMREHKECRPLLDPEEYNKYEDAEMYPGGAAYRDVMGYNDGLEGYGPDPYDDY
jgi:hypothetical protein